MTNRLRSGRSAYRLGCLDSDHSSKPHVSRYDSLRVLEAYVVATDMTAPLPLRRKCGLRIRSLLSDASPAWVKHTVQTSSLCLLLSPIWAADYSLLAQPPAPTETILHGRVTDADHLPAAGAVIRADGEGNITIQTSADERGEFALTVPRPGRYALTANKGAKHSSQVNWATQDGQSVVELVLASPTAQAIQDKGTASTQDQMEFADKPTFTIAGVTDWTAVGGHGTDSSVRTSEIVSQEAMKMKPLTAEPSGSAPAVLNGDSHKESTLRGELAAAPTAASYRALGEYYLKTNEPAQALPLFEDAARIQPDDSEIIFDLAVTLEKTGELSKARRHLQSLLRLHPDARFYHLAAEIDEKNHDPLSAVREFEIAAELDPSEENLFAWGAELLLHRAFDQARSVLEKGAEAFPQSSRMQAALGASFLAGALYESAAERLCKASDLNPTSAEPYLLLGKIALSAPVPLPCVESHMARFRSMFPTLATAQYLYAMALWKVHTQNPDADSEDEIASLLNRAVSLDKNCAEAYLQLGILQSSQGHLEQAIQQYEQAIRANPKLSEAHFRLGLAYERLHHPDKAKKEFRVHETLDQLQADAIEEERRGIKQFKVQADSTH